MNMQIHSLPLGAVIGPTGWFHFHFFLFFFFLIKQTKQYRHTKEKLRKKRKKNKQKNKTRWAMYQEDAIVAIMLAYGEAVGRGGKQASKQADK